MTETVVDAKLIIVSSVGCFQLFHHRRLILMKGVYFGTLSKALAKSSRIASMCVLLFIVVIQSQDSQDSSDWKRCWKWRMMLCLCRCFHILLRIFAGMHVSEMGL